MKHPAFSTIAVMAILFALPESLCAKSADDLKADLASIMPAGMKARALALGD